MAFSTGYFARDFIPCTWEHWVSDIQIDGKHVALALWDTSSREDYNRLRPLSYVNAHVALICYAVDSPESLESVKMKWIFELRVYCKKIPILLVACKKDLRDNRDTSDAVSRVFVSTESGVETARMIKVSGFIECSALTGEAVNDVFEKALRCPFRIKTKRKLCLIL
ncbi:GTP-binding protein Rho1 [Linnemannia zychae]|nr:GTP-binding protein Rho1 [Linnemannia zychae]